MGRRRLVWHLFAAYAVIVGLVLAVVYALATKTVHRSQVELFSTELQARAILARALVAPLPDSLIDPVCKTLHDASGARITVVDSRGRVLGDSEAHPSLMENHADRPEISRALAGEAAVSIRQSGTTRRRLLYATEPIGDASGVRAVVRAAIPFSVVEASVRDLYVRFAVIAASTALLLLLLSIGIARRVSVPLRRLTENASAFAQGDLHQGIAYSGVEEIDDLADALGQMAQQLAARIAVTTRQRNEREAVLASMTEGVLAIDPSERVAWMNEACGRMLGVSPERAVGRAIQESLRNSQLQALVRRAMVTSDPVEADLTVLGDGDRFLQAHGTVLRDPQGEGVGAVVVLNDVTRLRRLEQIRRDFVANVSHELKTPVAAIQGAAETLHEGALAQAEDAERFVEIIQRQSSRLDAVIRDLLTLSRIEEDEQRAMALMEGALEPVLKAAMQACSPATAAKGITLTVSCPEALRARMDPALLETAVVNLLDNAIKYSQPGGMVEVNAEGGGEIVISVVDHGCGIEARHLSRLFERFYRVDKARSRTMGGTGLGLAIVKHIVQAHHGRVSVESTPGIGSTFRIHLPLPS